MAGDQFPFLLRGCGEAEEFEPPEVAADVILKQYECVGLSCQFRPVSVNVPKVVNDTRESRFVWIQGGYLRGRIGKKKVLRLHGNRHGGKVVLERLE